MIKDSSKFVAIGAFWLALMLGAPQLAAHEGEEKEAASAEELSADQQAVVDTLNQYAAAMEASDLDGIAAVVTADDSFSSFEGTHLDVGWDSYREHVAPEMALFEDTKYTFSDIKPAVIGDLAYATLRYEMDVVVVSDEFENGRHPIYMAGAGTVVLERRDDSWKIRHMHMAREKGEVKQSE